jgi:hypothetical protein
VYILSDLRAGHDIAGPVIIMDTLSGTWLYCFHYFKIMIGSGELRRSWMLFTSVSSHINSWALPNRWAGECII